MTISVSLIKDSISKEGIRLCTFQLRYPRFIHSEVMTHRVFSRNASSSRAIPVERLIDDIIKDTAMPMFWGKNQPGMQAWEECDELVSFRFMTETTMGIKTVSREEAWIEARDRAIEIARAFAKSGYHKQIVNRLLEPFAHINFIVTSTEWDNFFHLRDHKDAQPEFQLLALGMKIEMERSTPTLLHPGEWHLPYIRSSDIFNAHIDDLIKASVARCARVSYLTHDHKEPDLKKDRELYEKLVGSEPLHASPAEHQATPDERCELEFIPFWKNPHLHGNFKGWIQYRKTIEGTFK